MSRRPTLSLVPDAGDLRTMTTTCTLWLGMPSRADNVALVRQAFGGLADAVGISEPLLADVKTAVSGTEVRMTFAADHDLGGPDDDSSAAPATPPTDGLEVSIGQGELVAPVL